MPLRLHPYIIEIQGNRILIEHRDLGAAQCAVVVIFITMGKLHFAVNDLIEAGQHSGLVEIGADEGIAIRKRLRCDRIHEVERQLDAAVRDEETALLMRFLHDHILPWRPLRGSWHDLHHAPDQSGWIMISMVSSSSSNGSGNPSSSTSVTPHRQTSPSITASAMGSRLLPLHGPSTHSPVSISKLAPWRPHLRKARSRLKNSPAPKLS